MNKSDFENKHNVLLLPKDKSWPMRIIGFFSKTFTYRFWTTYRLPFQKKARITYPPDVNPIKPWHLPTLEHELIHVKDMSTSWGLFKIFWLLWLIPLPIIFSGRWFIERHAYLHNIINHDRKIESVVNILWNGYGWVWPKYLMRKWFEKKVKENSKE
jgi:hypothetical protein